MKEINYEEIINRILNMLEKDYRLKREYTNYLGKTRQLILDWKYGKTKPTLDILAKTAKYFGVPLEYILFGEESPIDDATAAFLVQTKDLTDEQKKVIFASIKAQVDMFKQMNQEKK